MTKMDIRLLVLSIEDCDSTRVGRVGSPRSDDPRLDMCVLPALRAAERSGTDARRAGDAPLAPRARALRLAHLLS